MTIVMRYHMNHRFWLMFADVFHVTCDFLHPDLYFKKMAGLFTMKFACQEDFAVSQELTGVSASCAKRFSHAALGFPVRRGRRIASYDVGVSLSMPKASKKATKPS